MENSFLLNSFLSIFSQSLTSIPQHTSVKYATPLSLLHHQKLKNAIIEPSSVSDGTHTEECQLNQETLGYGLFTDQQKDR